MDLPVKTILKNIVAMKIYFCGSVRGGRQLAGVYAEMIGVLQNFGNVLSEHLGDDRAIESGDRKLTDREIHDRDMGWISESDVLVAEVTVPSLGVGYEVGRAVEMKKPVLCLFNPALGGHLSAMIAGCEPVKVVHYSRIEELEPILNSFINPS